MFKYITSKPLWVNILAALGILLVLVLLFFAILGWLTGHGKNKEVPNVVGQNVVAATKILKDNGFDVEVQDSVFIDSIGRLAVTKQSPEATTNVKAGRTIYLTINRAIAPEVTMPNLLGFSFKSAQYMLQTLHLKVGDTSYRPDFGRNTILEQSYNGKPIKEGTKLHMGSSISFVLSSGLGNTDMPVADFYGLTVEEALNRMQTMGLSRGSIIVQGGSVTDTMKAYIVNQNPVPFAEPTPGQKVQNRIKPGQLVDLYISAAAPAPRAIDTTKQTTPSSSN